MNTKPDYRAICAAAREKIAEQRLTETRKPAAEVSKDFETFNTPETAMEWLRGRHPTQ